MWLGLGDTSPGTEASPTALAAALKQTEPAFSLVAQGWRSIETCQGPPSQKPRESPTLLGNRTQEECH